MKGLKLKNRVKININKFRMSFLHHFEKFKNVAEEILPLRLYNKIERGIRKEKLNFSMELWAECVCFLILNYKKNTQKVIDLLTTLWLGRVASYCKEVNKKNVSEAEKIIREQAPIFEVKKKFLV